MRRPRLRLENFDLVTRRHALAELELDRRDKRLFVPERLDDAGATLFPALLMTMLQHGSPERFADLLRGGRLLLDWEACRQPSGRTTLRRVPVNAPEVLAEEAFNRFYMRGLATRAVAEGVPALEVYRAKAVASPRPTSQSRLGALLDPETLLRDLRENRATTGRLGLPAGPGSGLSVRFPRPQTAPKSAPRPAPAEAALDTSDPVPAASPVTPSRPPVGEACA